MSPRRCSALPEEILLPSRSMLRGGVNSMHLRLPIMQRQRRSNRHSRSARKPHRKFDNFVLLAKLERDDVRPVEPFDLTSLLKDDIIEPRRVLAPSVRFDLDVAV